VLVQPLLAHERSGVAASADLVDGGRERHLVDAVTWQGAHDLLTGRVTSRQTDSALPDAVTRQVSRLAAAAERALGRPAEVEWGLQGDRVTLYQARALTGEPPPVTVTNSHLVELPRYPLTPLSHAFLWGEGEPVEVLRGALGSLGLGALPDTALRVVRGRVMLDVSAFKGLALGLDGGLRAGTLLSALFGRTGRGAAAQPTAPDLALDGLSAAAHADRLRDLRVASLMPLVRKQMRALVVAAALDAWLEAACGEGDAPAPRARRPDAGDAWYRAEREAELASPRRLEGEGASPGGAPEPAPDAGARRGLLVPWVAWARDRQLTEREALNAEINVVNHVARQHALALDELLAGAAPGWPAGDVFYCTPSELCALAGDPGAGPGADERAARRLRHEADEAAVVPGVCDLDASGEPVARRLGAPVDGALATGAAIGRGQVSGSVCVARDGDDLEVEAARDQLLVVHGGAPAWGQHVLVARAVVLVGAGPLSHLALLARERGIPVLASATGAPDDLQAGDQVTLDLESASLRREG